MNLKSMKFFFDSRFDKLTGTEKLMLLSLMLYANEQGEGIWPAVDSLAARANVKHSQAQKILKKLEKIGYLMTVHNAKGGSRYATKWRRLNMNLIRKDANPLRPVAIVQDADQGGAVEIIEPVDILNEMFGDVPMSRYRQ